MESDADCICGQEMAEVEMQIDGWLRTQQQRILDPTLDQDLRDSPTYHHCTLLIRNARRWFARCL